MEHAASQELEGLALAAELGRQVAHDSGNFVYNVLLQIELMERFPEPARHDWTGIKQDAKKLAQRLKEWQSFRGNAPAETGEVDLNRTIQGILNDVRAEGRPVCLDERLTPGPLRIMSVPGVVKRLCRLLLDHAIGAGADKLALATEARAAKALVRIGNLVPAPSNLCWLDDGSNDAPPHLETAACRAMAYRLEASIRAEKEPTGKISVIVEFPRNLS